MKYDIKWSRRTSYSEKDRGPFWCRDLDHRTLLARIINATRKGSIIIHQIVPTKAIGQVDAEQYAVGDLVEIDDMDIGNWQVYEITEIDYADGKITNLSATATGFRVTFPPAYVKYGGPIEDRVRPRKSQEQLLTELSQLTQEFGGYPELESEE